MTLENGDVYRKDEIVYTTGLARLANSLAAKMGDPHLDPCADFVHQSYRKGYVVFVTGLSILVANWEAKVLSSGCPRTDAEMGL